MLRIDREGKKFMVLKKHGMSEAGLTEKQDLQAMIKGDPKAFFREMGEELLVIVRHAWLVYPVAQDCGTI